MTIIKTRQTSNFVVTPAAIISNRSLSANARAALIYLLSKPPSWKIQITDLRKMLCLGRDKVYQVLRELRAAGYAVMTRLQRGVSYDIYDVPQTPAQAKKAVRLTEYQCTENQDALVRIEKAVKKENDNAPVETTSVVVYDIKQIELPAAIPVQERKACQAILSKVNDQAVRQDVLFALCYAITAGQVKSTPAYLVGLIKAAKAGTLTKPAQTPIPKGQQSKLWDEQKRQPKPVVNNHSFFESLRKQFGSRVNSAIPPQYQAAGGAS